MPGSTVPSIPVVVGITDYAQDQLGDLVFVDLPSVGDSVNAGEPAVELESRRPSTSSSARSPAP